MILSSRLSHYDGGDVQVDGGDVRCGVGCVQVDDCDGMMSYLCQEYLLSGPTVPHTYLTMSCGAA